LTGVATLMFANHHYSIHFNITEIALYAAKQKDMTSFLVYTCIYYNIPFEALVCYLIQQGATKIVYIAKAI